LSLRVATTGCTLHSGSTRHSSTPLKLPRNWRAGESRRFAQACNSFLTFAAMKLSIIILCWNDRTVIGDCLRSIYEQTHVTDFEIIVSDNGSTDGSVQFIRESFPRVCVLE